MLYQQERKKREIKDYATAPATQIYLTKVADISLRKRQKDK